MNEEAINSLRDFLDGAFRPGETVILEYSSEVPIHVVFAFLLRLSREWGYSVVVDDIVDALPRITRLLEMGGLGGQFLDEDGIYVIKIGGNERTGNVVAHLRFSSDYYVQRAEYRRAFDRISLERGFVINLVLGFDRRLLMTDSHYDRFLFTVGGAPYLGNRKRIALYFLNRDILEEYPAETSILEEIATSIVRLGWEDGNFVVEFTRTVKKPPSKILRVPGELVVEYLGGEGVE